MCELELMQMDRMFGLHRFTDVSSPGTAGWWFFISGLEAERQRGGRGKGVSTPFRAFM